MAEEKKRIIALTEKTAMDSGDYCAIDNSTGGTKKFPLGSTIGVLSNLTTTNKSNLVAAINEAAQSGGGGSITVDSALSASSTNPVQNKVIYSALQNIDGGAPDGVQFPHHNSVVCDIQNKYAVNNAYELGTSGTLRHNMMLESDSNYVIATWTESTGTKDYADSSGQTSVYAQLWRDKWGTRAHTIDSTILYSDVYDVFPHGATVYGADGNALCTVVAASDSTVKKVGNTFYFLAIVYGSDSSKHIVYRTASNSSTSSTQALTLGGTINVCKIGDSEWDMTTLGQGYTDKTSQVNTYIILRSSVYYMPVVQSGKGIAIMTSSDCITWSLLKHIDDEEAHLEAALCALPWVSNNMVGAFLAVRHNYGNGYLTLYGFEGLTFNTIKSKAYIPASTGRPMMFSDSNVKQAYLAFSVNGRRNSVFVRLSSNNDGTTGYEFLTCPLNVMSNYPCVTWGNASSNGMLWIGGTNGLGSDKKGVSLAPIWLDELYDYSSMDDGLTDVAVNGAATLPSSATTGQVLTYNGSAWVAANLPLYNGGIG